MTRREGGVERGIDRGEGLEMELDQGDGQEEILLKVWSLGNSEMDFVLIHGRSDYIDIDIPHCNPPYTIPSHHSSCDSSSRQNIQTNDVF